MANCNPDSNAVTQKNSDIGANKFQCPFCDKKFASHKTKRSHFRRFHPQELKNLIPPGRASKNYKFQCKICGCNFSQKATFDYHMRKAHSSEVEPLVKKSVPCFTCKVKVEKSKFFSHLQLEHNIQVETESFEFNNIQDFHSWKEAMERETKESFISERGSRSYCNKKVFYYTCHRSGFQKCNANSRKTPKLKGSKKINGFCPASIKLICFEETGRVEAKFTKTHIGHSNEMAHLYLLPSERQTLAAKIAAKVPFDDILDEARNSITRSGLERIHLLTKKDLYNIQSSFSLNCNVLKHKDDGSIVEASDNETNTNDNDFNIVEADSDNSIDELNRNNLPLDISIEKRKEKLKLKCIQIIKNLQSNEELQAVKNILNSVQPTIDAMRLKNLEKSNLPNIKERVPVNKTQTQLFSSIKKRKNTAHRSIQTPIVKEKKSIVFKLIPKHKSLTQL